MKKLLFVITAAALLAGCGKGGEETPAEPSDAADAVELLVWCEASDIELFEERAEAFRQKNPDTAYTITIQAESLETVSDTVLADPEAAADVFAYPENESDRLFEAGAIPYREDGIYGYPLKDNVLLGLNPNSAHFDEAEALARALAKWGE